MRERLQTRLETLRVEFEKGHAELERVERQGAILRETLLRIGGAIQVLEELLAEDQFMEDRATGHRDPRAANAQSTAHET